jgi:mercuric ion binding protein
MMRTRITIVIVLLLVAVGAFAAATQTVTLDVQSMTCPTCKITVKKALEKVPGVSEATIDYDKKTATVRFDPDKTNTPTLVKATTDAGYPSIVRK